MLSVEAAKALLFDLSLDNQIETIPIELAFRRVLAQAITAPVAMPPFRQSAMDGYALKLGTGTLYDLQGSIPAGSSAQPTLTNNTAVRIFTGAAVPNDADAVIRQERVKDLGNGRIELLQIPKVGQNIRPKGEQVQAGALALKAGTTLTAAAIGYLATLGVQEVSVYALPKIALVVTGDELVAAGQPLKHGQIYESNAIMLQAALEADAYATQAILKVPDDFEQTCKQLKIQLEQQQVVIITGGISVGDHDYVGKALETLGVEQLFYKVRQKPGKPMYVGRYQQCLVFALPGNPAAALTGYYEYVRPTLQRLTGKNIAPLPKIYLPLAEAYTKKGDRAQFLKAKLQETSVAILEGQSSAMLHTFALADALIYLPHDQSDWPKGSLVEVHLLPVV